MTEQVESTEDIVKHVRATLVHGDKVDGVAFLPRANDTDGSSVNRLRVFSDDDDAAMVEIRARFRLQLRDSHRFAQVNVGELTECISEFFSIHVVADPLLAQGVFPEDPSHALIKNLPTAGVLDDLIGDLIKRRVKRLHPAV